MESKGALSDIKPLTIFYHGGCADGFVSATMLYLHEFSSHQTSPETPTLDVYLNLLQKTFTETKGPGQIRRIIKDEDIASLPVPEFSGSVSYPKFEDFESQARFIPFYHQRPEEKLDFVSSLPQQERRLCIMADLCNFEVAIKLCEIYEEVYIVDHHRTVSKFFEQENPEEGLPANLRIIFNKKFSGSQMLFYMTTRFSDCLCRCLEPEFGKNLATTVKLINENDTLPRDELSQDAREYVCALYDIGYVWAFCRSSDPKKPISDFLKFDPDIYIQIGRPKLAARVAAVEKRSKKAKEVSFQYKKRNCGEPVTVRCLFCQAESKYASDLGNTLAKLSLRRGMNPIGVVATKYSFGGDKGMKLAFRAVKIEGDELDGENVVEMDCEEVAHFFGGGGHKLAAGAKVKNLGFLKVLAN